MEVASMAQQVPLHSSIWIWLVGLIGCNFEQSAKPILSIPIVPDSFVQYHDTALRNSNGVIYYHGYPYSGKIVALYTNKKDTAFIRSYWLGKEHGEWKSFYENGQLKEHRFFMEGKKTGEYLVWWPNGKKFMHYQLENDEYQGLCLEWNEQGRLVKRMNYLNGHEDGPQKWWYNNGKIKANYIIQDGRRFGLLGTKNCINVTDSIFKN